jgi:phosphoribosylglycinamide formyltransferase-1
MPLSPFPIAVLISGTGSNLQALIDQADDAYRIAVVIADRPDAAGLGRARTSGIPTEIVSWSSFSDRDSFTDAVCGEARDAGAEGLILAGFMRILGPSAIAEFPDAIINVHPALLPAFPGAHAVEQALEHGVRYTGVTVHFVDEEVDHGPIIAQEPVAVLPNDGVESLHARIQTVEHSLLPRVVSAFGRGELAVEGRHVRWMQPTHADGVA